MGTRGRKPIPPELKILKGPRGAAPAAVAGEPEPPAYLGDEARAEWGRMVEVLRALGVLSRTDGQALALYCTLHARLVRAEADVAENGLREATEKGGDKPNPAVVMADRAIRQMAALLAEFGLTPSSRGRVKGTTPKAEDRLGTFIGRKRKGG